MSSTPLHHFCNREFAQELCDLLERNVILLMVDGSAALGRISNIDDGVLRLLPPIGILIGGVALGTVLFRPPNDNLIFSVATGELLVDVCDIAHVVEGSFTGAISTAFLTAAFPPAVPIP